MNRILLQTIANNKALFMPDIIAPKQMNTIEKYLQNKKLTRTEQTYLYNHIRRKIHALQTIIPQQKPQLYFYNPQDMIEERKQQAIDILTKFKAQGKQAFISGSFLFMDKYNDIDIFIFSKERKDFYEGKEQHIYFREQDLTKPIFQSAAKSCIANFEITLPPIRKRKLHFSQTLMSYQEAIILILNKDDTKDIKQFITDYATYYLNTTFNSNELNMEYQKLIGREDKIAILSKMIKELLLENFNKKYILKKLKRYVGFLEEDIKNIKPTDHLKIYKKTYEEIINECK